MARTGISRRTFVERAAAASAFTIVPRRVLGRGYRAPSDTLNVACVGVGGMGGNDVDGVSKENVYALVDVDWRQAEGTFRKFPKAKRYRDFRELLDKDVKNFDAVTVSTPDHTHAVVTLAALRAGKHVYTQKPLCRTLGEVRAVMDEARRRPRQATQMGNQGHAGEGIRLMREWVEAGLIGTVREVHYWTNRPIWPQAIERPTEAHNSPPTMSWDLWLGPAPSRPYHPAYAPFRWRGWWDFGCGALGDIACHSMDAAHWILGLGYPTRIEAESTTLFAETAPRASRIVYRFPATAGRPELTVVWRDGSILPPRPPEIAADAQWPAPTEEGGQLWIGDSGKLVAGMYAQNPRLLDDAKNTEVKEKPLPVKYPRTEGVYAEWIAACKADAQPGSTFATQSGPLTEMVLLGNLAVRAGRHLELDATGRVTNTTIPEDWVRPTSREGWTV